MGRFFLLAVLFVTLTGCVCTQTPEDEQRWYEYQRGFMRDGYNGNVPWYYYPVAVPGYLIVSLFGR